MGFAERESSARTAEAVAVGSTGIAVGAVDNAEEDSPLAAAGTVAWAVAAAALVEVVVLVQVEASSQPTDRQCWGQLDRGAAWLERRRIPAEVQIEGEHWPVQDWWPSDP